MAEPPTTDKGAWAKVHLLGDKPSTRRRQSHVPLRERSAAFCKNIGIKAVSFFLRSANNDTEEKPKVIIRRHFWTAFTRCLVHIIPVSATAVLAWLNLAGFYIGGDLEGFHGEYALATKMLSLQSTAKLMELLLVASIGTVVLDVLRHEMMFGKDGIPLGMLGADLQFANLGWFWSPEFLSGRKAFVAWRKCWLLTIFFVFCGFLALFVGPSSALLLIPVYRDNWAAGGTDFYLAGDNQTLWPERLTAEHVGFTDFANCLDPTPDAVYTQAFSSSGCVWDGYQSLISIYRSQHQNHIINITVTDGTVNRILQGYADYGADAFTIAPNIAAAAPSGNIARAWLDSIQSLRGISSYDHYQRLPFGAVVRVSGYIPSVRARCNPTLNFDFAHNESWLYPFFPENGPFSQSFYALKPGSFLNSTTVTTEWREVPNGAMQTTDGNSTSYSPSAFLNLQVPHNGSFEGGWFYSCSVDARWIRADTIGADYDGFLPEKYYVYGEDVRPNPYFPFVDEYLPAHGPVQMSLDWLNALTPSLNSSIPGFTTLASIYQAEGLDNAFTDQRRVFEFTESIIATVVADGMSRVGYSANGGNLTLVTFQNEVFDRYNISSTDFYSTVYKGTAKLPPPAGYTAANSTLLRWSVTIPGYSYSADGVAYWLALIVLLAHAALAVAHTAWTLYARTTSDSWDSLAELLVLTQNSPPAPDALRNTCAGIAQEATMRRTAKIRVVAKDAAAGRASGYEQVQLVYSGDDAVDDAVTSQVQIGTAYGAV